MGERNDADAVVRSHMGVAHVVGRRGPEPLLKSFWCADVVPYALFYGHEDVRTGIDEREAFGDVVLDPSYQDR